MYIPLNIATDLAKLKEKKELLLKELEEIIIAIAKIENEEK